MKIKLYNCGNKSGQQSEYALGLGYLKSNCDADIEIVKDRKELVDCDMIGLSSVADGVKEAIEILRTHKIKVIIGGQCTLWEGLKDYPFAHIVYGEGERALQQIIDGNAPRLIHCENIPEIDVLNYPYRGRCDDVVPIVTSRGCPWNCNFCSSQKYWGRPRYHSAEYFLYEVKHILALYPQMKILYILDDLFIADRERFDSIYEYWMTADFVKNFSLMGFVRSTLMDKDTALKLKRMGFKSVRFGAESGSNRMLKLLNKRARVEDHQRCIDICNEVGLEVCFSLLVCPPGETIKDRWLTCEFIRKNRGKAYISGHYAFRPYPGTKYYNNESLLEGDWNTR